MSNHPITPYRSSGVLRDLLLRVKLVLRLMADRRIHPLLKLLPILSVAYLLWMFDPVPIYIPILGGIDDVAVLWIGTSLFIELCPTEVVQEHLKQLTSNIAIVEGEIVEGEIKE
jgi:uncharacterized membrane protein YkvA (DUF1232 family)